MSIAIDSVCLECVISRNLKKVRALGTEEQAEVFLEEFRKIYEAAPRDVSSPWFSPVIADLLLKFYGVPLDRFREEKELSNRFVMERLDTIREKVFSAADPVLAGLQFAILGNYLDFAALQGQVSFEKLDAMLDKAFSLNLDKAVYDNLCQELQEGKKLLYLTDNAGEIGFDRIFCGGTGKAVPPPGDHLLRPGRHLPQRCHPGGRCRCGYSFPGHR